MESLDELNRLVFALAVQIGTVFRAPDRWDECVFANNEHLFLVVELCCLATWCHSEPAESGLAILSCCRVTKGLMEDTVCSNSVWRSLEKEDGLV